MTFETQLAPEKANAGGRAQARPHQRLRRVSWSLDSQDENVRLDWLRGAMRTCSDVRPIGGCRIKSEAALSRQRNRERNYIRTRIVSQRASLD